LFDMTPANVGAKRPPCSRGPRREQSDLRWQDQIEASRESLREARSPHTWQTFARRQSPWAPGLDAKIRPRAGSTDKPAFESAPN
jgi:hypothetical protein